MILTRTPYRISFFGGGTDYPAWFDNFGEGAVISTTINKYCYLSCRYLPPFFDKKSRIVWSKIELADNPDEIEHPAVREALKMFGIKEGVEIHHHGDLPSRSGMGSSSSFAVGLSHALHTLKGFPTTKMQLALSAIDLEQNRIGESVGCQDQVAAAYGGFNKIIFGGTEKISVRPISISPEAKNLLEENFLMFYTGLSRTASEIAKEQIRVTAEKEKDLRRILSLVSEAEKVFAGQTSSLDDIGLLLHEAWMVKRGLTNKISNSEIDNIYEQARSAGAVGGKLLGAGGGGFLLFYVKPEDQARVKERLKGVLNIPFKFENEGSKVIYTDGA